jgi:hypothetical protein
MLLQKYVVRTELVIGECFNRQHFTISCQHYILIGILVYVMMYIVLSNLPLKLDVYVLIKAT